MKKILYYDMTFADFHEKYGTLKAAKLLNLTNGAIWFMAHSDREIYVRKRRGATEWEYREVKPYQRGNAGGGAKKAA